LWCTIEVDPVKRFGKFLQLCLPVGKAGGTGTLKKFPIANRRRVGDFPDSLSLPSPKSAWNLSSDQVSLV